MSREILDCLKRERDIYIKNVIHSQNTAFMFTPALKPEENFKLLALKVVAVAYERWSLTRGSKYSDLTWKLLVRWKTGR